MKNWKIVEEKKLVTFHREGEVILGGTPFKVVCEDHATIIVGICTPPMYPKGYVVPPPNDLDDFVPF